MYGIGKGTVINMLLKGHTLDKLGDSEAQMNDIVEESTKFAAACYGSKAKGNMSEIRYDVWTTRTGRRKVTTTPKLNALPPTTEAFEENAFGRQLVMKILQTWILLDLVGAKITETSYLFPSQCPVVFNQHLQKFFK